MGRRRPRLRAASAAWGLAAAALLVAGIALPWAGGARAEPSGGDGSRTRASARAFARPFHVIAHRGASALAPENTLPAFERALELGVFEVELDVRRSRDGELFLFHDRRLDEKSDAVGAFSDKTSAELRRVDVGSWFDGVHPGLARRHAGTRLLTLRELFDHFGDRLFYHVEIKGPEADIPEGVVRAIAEFGLAQRAVVTSFSFDQLERVRALDASLPTCWLIERSDELRREERARDVGADLADVPLLDLQRRALARARAAGFAQVGIAASDISSGIVGEVHAAGLEVRGWGVRDDADIDRVIDAGANGMTIDWPERLIRRLLESAAQVPRQD